jgi:hypothetical protein
MLGEIAQCILCTALSSGLPEGLIVLGFVGTLIDMNPGSTMQVLERSCSTKNQQPTLPASVKLRPSLGRRIPKLTNI